MTGNVRASAAHLGPRAVLRSADNVVVGYRLLARTVSSERGQGNARTDRYESRTQRHKHKHTHRLAALLLHVVELGRACNGLFILTCAPSAR
jgi:hypothetical protein